MYSIDNLRSVFAGERSVEIVEGFCRFYGYSIKDGVVSEGDVVLSALSSIDLACTEGFRNALTDFLDLNDVGFTSRQIRVLDFVEYNEVMARIVDAIVREYLDVVRESSDTFNVGGMRDVADVGDTVRIVDYVHYELPEGVRVGELYVADKSYEGDILVEASNGNFVLVPWENYTVVRSRELVKS